MSDHTHALNARSDGKARQILVASNPHLNDYIRRGIMERSSIVVPHLNTLENQPATRDLARRALQRLGFAMM